MQLWTPLIIHRWAIRRLISEGFSLKKRTELNRCRDVIRSHVTSQWRHNDLLRSYWMMFFFNSLTKITSKLFIILPFIIPYLPTSSVLSPSSPKEFQKGSRKNWTSWQRRKVLRSLVQPRYVTQLYICKKVLTIWLHRIPSVNSIQEKRKHTLFSKFILYCENSCLTVQVGGIKPGCFRIGNTGGMLDNILASKLYRPGRWDRTGQERNIFCVL